MSLSQQNYSKDSFDRFGDDLCQLLLSYLSVEQKLLFECVSKQWKSFIFNKQQKLIIKLKNSFKRFENGVIKSFDTNNDIIYVYNNHIIKVLLKKFVFINDLSIELIDNQTLHIIAKYCSHLKKIDIISSHGFISSSVKPGFVKFGQKCGQKLESIRIERKSRTIEINDILLLTPNLKTIYLSQFDQLISFNEVFLQKLQEIHFNYMCLRNLNQLNTFSNKYHKQIKKIKISMFFNRFELANDSVNNALKEFSRFECLQSLVIRIENRNHSNNNAINSGLELIANKCKSLQHLDILMTINSITGNLFEVFHNMKALKKFIITICGQNSNQNYGSVQYLKDCQNLKHFELDIRGFCNDILEDIDLHLPNLTHFVLKTPDNILPEQLLHKLAKMKSLSHIDIYSRIHLSDAEICHFIENSVNIKEMTFRNIKFIRRKTIEAMIERALKTPKVQYSLQFEEKFKNTENLEFIKNFIPSNLIIKPNSGCRYICKNYFY
jgi:hypothetical protein